MTLFPSFSACHLLYALPCKYSQQFYEILTIITPVLHIRKLISKGRYWQNQVFFGYCFWFPQLWGVWQVWGKEESQSRRAQACPAVRLHWVQAGSCAVQLSSPGPSPKARRKAAQASSAETDHRRPKRALSSGVGLDLSARVYFLLFLSSGGAWPCSHYSRIGGTFATSVLKKFSCLFFIYITILNKNSNSCVVWGTGRWVLQGCELHVWGI